MLSNEFFQNAVDKNAAKMYRIYAIYEIRIKVYIFFL
jgi:hypothetical protein